MELLKSEIKEPQKRIIEVKAMDTVIIFSGKKIYKDTPSLESIKNSSQEEKDIVMIAMGIESLFRSGDVGFRELILDRIEELQTIAENINKN